ncbi:MAG: hypothetical protein HWD82_01640 [Flavobacteriaceae bacterium]|nr:hypothetical protein [Flavobacteriaceae bacterium]
MEKLSRLTFLAVFSLLLLSNSLFSQKRLCVIETKGNPHVQEKTNYKSINKGDIFTKDVSLQLESAETIKFIDEKGDLYVVNDPGTFSFSKVLTLKVNSSKVSVTKKYFNYLYKKMINDYEKNSNAGVVYRTRSFGDLIYPKNKRLIIKDTIHFEWMNDKFKPLTFLLEDLDAKESYKITTNGNYLTLVVDGKLLKEGKNYKWTVFDATHKAESFNFSILDKTKKIDLTTKVDIFKKELVGLDFDKSRVSSLIADYYNVQY